MAIDEQTVKNIARLARLEVDENEILQYRNELSNILELVSQMDAADTDDVAPMTHPMDATLRLREDSITETNQRDKFQAIAPAAESGLYLVPKVLD